jgi:hypothetical protein
MGREATRTRLWKWMWVPLRLLVTRCGSNGGLEERLNHRVTGDLIGVVNLNEKQKPGPRRVSILPFEGPGQFVIGSVSLAGMV